MFRKDRTKAKGGGVAIIINRNIPYEAIHLPYIDIEYLAIKILKPFPLILAAVSLPPRGKINIAALEKLINLHPKSSLIIGGDFNAKHIAWNNLINCSRGKALKDFTDKNSINILFPNSPTHIRGNSRSVIDFFLSNIAFASKCTTINDLFSSHLPVILDIECKKPISLLKETFTTDWAMYKETYNNFTINTDIKTKDDIDNEILRLHSRITSAY